MTDKKSRNKINDQQEFSVIKEGKMKEKAKKGKRGMK
jgi:hypothetical protein